MERSQSQGARCLKSPLFTKFQRRYLQVALVAVIATIAASWVATYQAQSQDSGNIYCASPDGSPDATGHCWDDPYDLQTALSVAEPGSQVRIKAGTYVPGDGPHSAFYLPAGVDVVGGYSGSSDDPDQRDSNPLLTVMDGQGERYTVLIVAGASDASLTGVTIRDGAATLIADDATDLQRRGGGVYISNSSVTMSNIVIANNRARFGGGGVYVDESSSITFRNATFQGNQTTHPQSGRGGGLRIREGSAELFDVIFRFNKAIRGGGIFVDSGEISIGHALFAENEAADRGGGLSLYQGDLRLEDSRFARNLAIREGAGMFVSRAGGEIVMNRVVFTQNDAGDGGGGAWIQARNVTLEECSLIGNTAGFGAGGGLYLANATAELNRVRLQGNQSGQGGGLAVRNAAVTIMNGLVAGNLAGQPSIVIDREAGRPPPDDPDRENFISDPWRAVITGEAFSSDYLVDAPGEDALFAGGGVFLYGDGETTLVNTTIAANESLGHGAAVYRAGKHSVSILNSIVARNYRHEHESRAGESISLFSRDEEYDDKRVSIERSLLDFECEETPDARCQSVQIGDPRFLSIPDRADIPAVSGDYRLWFTSPAIDAADASLADGLDDRDLAGEPRFVVKRFDQDDQHRSTGLDLGPFETQIQTHRPDTRISVAYSDESVDIVVDVSTNSTGTASGTVSATTPEFAFAGVRLGRVYLERHLLLVIDGEAVLDDGRMAGFRVELQTQSFSTDVQALRLWLDTGYRTIWFQAN